MGTGVEHAAATGRGAEIERGADTGRNLSLVSLGDANRPSGMSAVQEKNFKNVLTDKNASPEEKLKAAEALCGKNSSREITIDDNGVKRSLVLEVEKASGGKQMVHVHATDERGKSFVVLRGIDDGKGNFAKEKDGHGKDVSFNGERWSKEHAGSSLLGGDKAAAKKNPAEKDPADKAAADKAAAEKAAADKAAAEKAAADKAAAEKAAADKAAAEKAAAEKAAAEKAAAEKAAAEKAAAEKAAAEKAAAEKAAAEKAKFGSQVHISDGGKTITIGEGDDAPNFTRRSDGTYNCTDGKRYKVDLDENTGSVKASQIDKNTGKETGNSRTWLKNGNLVTVEKEGDTTTTKTESSDGVEQSKIVKAGNPPQVKSVKLTDLDGKKIDATWEKGGWSDWLQDETTETYYKANVDDAGHTILTRYSKENSSLPVERTYINPNGDMIVRETNAEGRDAGVRQVRKDGKVYSNDGAGNWIDADGNSVLVSVRGNQIKVAQLAQS